MQRKISERWMGQAVFIAAWVAGFIGIPAMIVTMGPEPPVFLWALPVVGLVGAGILLRRLLRAGFVVSEQGLSRTHQLGAEVVPWEQISAFDWEMGQSSSSDSGGGQRQTYRLVAVTAHGGVHVTSLPASVAGARQIMLALEQAQSEGIVPDRVAIHRPPTAGELLRTLGAAALGTIEAGQRDAFRSPRDDAEDDSPDEDASPTG